MNIEKLRAILLTAPYDKMSDEEAEIALNAKSIPVQGDVTKSRYVLWLAAHNGFDTIERAKAFEHVDPSIKAAVRSAGMAADIILRASDVPVINTGDEQVQQLFALFISVGLLDQQAVDSFMAYGVTMQSAGEIENLGPDIPLGLIQHARGKN